MARRWSSRLQRPSPGSELKSAAEWKRYYAAERAELDLERLVEQAPRVALPPMGALIFPHTRLRVMGAMVASVANAVIESRAERVLALGVLHGSRECDVDLVARAKAGDSAALSRARRVHGEGTQGDEGMASEEFSLDGFCALLEVAARKAKRDTPEVIARYPFLVGDSPFSLEGLPELRALVGSRCALVATTDPVHHGRGYGTAPSECRDLDARDFARDAIRAQTDALSKRDWALFQRHAQTFRSDFRDVGPTLAAVLGARTTFELLDVALVDYSAVLGAPTPTWVAGALLVADAFVP